MKEISHIGFAGFSAIRNVEFYITFLAKWILKNLLQPAFAKGTPKEFVLLALTKKQLMTSYAFISFFLTNSQLVCDTPIPNREGFFRFPSIIRPTPLIYAIVCHQPAVVKLLFTLGADFTSASHNSWHPIHYAAAVKNLEIVDFIINNCPNEINAETPDHKATPLHFAVSGNSPEIVALLLIRGANVNHQNQNGETALHMSMILFDYEITKILLSFGAQFEIQNSRKMNPKQIAELRRNNGMLEFLNQVASNPQLIPTKDEIKAKYPLVTTSSVHSEPELVADPESIIEHLDLLSQRVSAIEEAVGLNE